MNRKGFGLQPGLIGGILITVIMLILIFQAVGDTATDVGNAAGNATRSYDGGPLENSSVAPNDTFPLVSFFKKKGIILLAFAAGLMLVILTAVLRSK